jgi:Glycosyl hydrolase family 26
MRTRVTSMLLLVAAAILVACQHGPIKTASPRAPLRADGKMSTALELGVTTGPLARNWWRPWTATDLKTVDEFEHDAGKPAGIVMWYADWQHNLTPAITQLNEVLRRGSIPEITWEPWDASNGLYRAQPRYRLSNIITGKFDRYIWTWARSLASWHHAVLLRFAQEGDGNWFPWSAYGNGNEPGQFVAAWRHVHRIFALAGADNVMWVWSPAFARSAQTFPGTRDVNIMATTCQNAGKPILARGWQSFQKDCGSAIARLHALAPRLPIQLAEASSAERGGSKAQWIKQMFAYLDHHPDVTSLVWFNLVKGIDWRIESSASAREAFAAGARGPSVI